MEKISYIMSLKSPADRLTASLLFTVVFLAGGWATTSYNYSSYQKDSEKNKLELVRNCATEAIRANNIVMERQEKRMAIMDSTTAAANSKLKEINEFLENKK